MNTQSMTEVRRGFPYFLHIFSISSIGLQPLLNYNRKAGILWDGFPWNTSIV